MKISDTTLAILKNFSSINTNLFVREGNELFTMNTERNIISLAVVNETFPQEFGIYNLGELLGVLSMFKSPDVEFHGKYALIKEGKNTIRYVFSDPSVLTYPEKKLKDFEPAVNFDLPAETLANIMKSAAVLSAPDLEIRGADGKIEAIIQDVKNEFANQLTIDLEATTDFNFSVFLKVDRLKMQAGSYEVSFPKSSIVKFVNKDKELTYWVAPETNSSFKG